MSNTKIGMLLHKTFQPIVEYQVRNKKKFSSWFFLAVTHDLLWAYYIVIVRPFLLLHWVAALHSLLASSDEMKSDTKIK